MPYSPKSHGGWSEEKISRVFGFNRAIRFVSMVGQDGDLIESAARPGMVPLEPDEMTSSIFARAAIAWGMTEEMNQYHGKVRTAVVVTEKVILVSFFAMDRMFIVFADPDFPIGETEKLGQMLDGLSIDQTSQAPVPPKS